MTDDLARIAVLTRAGWTLALVFTTTVRGWGVTGGWRGAVPPPLSSSRAPHPGGSHRRLARGYRDYSDHWGKLFFGSRPSRTNVLG